VQRLHHRQSGSHGTEGWKDASEDNKLVIVQCATFSRSLNPKNIDKSISDIRIWFPFESSFWISVSGCKLAILPDIQPANQIVIVSGHFKSVLFRIPIFGVRSGRIMRFFWIRSRIEYHFCSSRIRIIQNVLNTF